MRQQLGRMFWGLVAFYSVASFLCASDLGTVDVLHPYSGQIVVEQGDLFWLTCPANQAPSIVEVDIDSESYGVRVNPGEKVPVSFAKTGKYTIVVNVDGYPARTLTVEVMPKVFAPEPPAQGLRTMSIALASGPNISMGSVYAGWYSNACDGTTGHKWPFRLVASAACSMELRIMSGGSGSAWSGSVNAGDNIIVVNNPSGNQWVLSPFVGGVLAGGTQTINTNTPYRLAVTNVVLTTNTLTHTTGTSMIGLETQTLVNDPVTWKVAPNCWWTLTNVCADLFLWTGTNLAASGLTNGAAYTNAGTYPVKTYVNINLAGAQADVVVLDLDTLTLTDVANPTNTLSDSTPDPTTPVTNTLVLSSPGGTATMTLDLTWQPTGVSYSGNKFKWMIEARGGAAASGWSSTSGIANGSPVTLTWSGATQYQYQVIGWIDRDDNGTTNTTEEQRLLYVDMLKVFYTLDHVCTAGVHAAHQVAVTTIPETIPTPVTLELLRETGSKGAAIFTNSGASTISISGNTNLTVMGTEGSDIVSNMLMRATLGGSVVTQVYFTVFDIERLDTWDNPHPTNLISDTDLADTNNPTLYVCQQSNDIAEMTFSVSGGLPKTGQHFNWRILRQNGQSTTQWTPNQGTTDTNAVNTTWDPPVGGPTNRWFVLETWYDCNANGTPAADEPHRKVNIEVVDVTKLTIEDLSSPRQIQDTTRQDEPLSTNNLLFVTEREVAPAKVKMTLAGASPPISGTKFRYEVLLTNNQPTIQWSPSSTGNWTSSPIILTWTNSLDLNGQTNRLFIARGWYDCDRDGIFDVEEPHRQAYIAVVGADYRLKDICTNGLHSSHDVAVNIEPEIPGVAVKMTIAKAGGNLGQAVFTANNNTELTTTADTNLTLRGIEHSGADSNMMVRAFFEGQQIKSRDFSIRDIRNLKAKRGGTPVWSVDDSTQATLPLNTLYIDQGTNSTLTVNLLSQVWPNNKYTTNHWWAFVLTNGPAFPPATDWNPQKTNTQTGVQSSVWTLPTGATTNRSFFLRSWYDCDGDGVMATNEPQREVAVDVVKIDLNVQKSLLTLKHDRDCNLEIKLAPETGVTVDSYRIDIKRTNSPTWYVLSTNKTMTPWQGNIAGGFHLRGTIRLGGVDYHSQLATLTNQFPNYTQIAADSNILTSTDLEWANTLADCTEIPNQRRERGFWIRLDTGSNQYTKGPTITGPWVTPGTGASMTPGPTPSDTPLNPPPNASAATYTVAIFHTHTPYTYWPTNFWRLVGPSPNDSNFCSNRLRVGIVYDYVGDASNRIYGGHAETDSARRYQVLPNRRPL